MTIPALLGHFGINHARYVTTGGRIVFEGVEKDASANYSHPEYGHVTPVNTHRFHDGIEETDHGTSGDKWWIDEVQIAKHVDAMSNSFPDFIYMPGTDDLSPSWYGEIDTGRGKFRILVVLRSDRGLPFVKVLGVRLGTARGRRWESAPHMYLNGNLCIADSLDWDADRDTAVTAVAWTCHWLAAYTEWRITRKWPVEGVENDAA